MSVKKHPKRTHKKAMHLEDYTTDDVEIGCDKVKTEGGDCRELMLTLENICWVDVAGIIARSDEDFIKCFIKFVRAIQKEM
jgi:hypothetical protein